MSCIAPPSTAASGDLTCFDTKPSIASKTRLAALAHGITIGNTWNIPCS